MCAARALFCLLLAAAALVAMPAQAATVKPAPSGLDFVVGRNSHADQVDNYRIVADWSALEPSKGSYRYGVIDNALAAHPEATLLVRLTAGIRSPRWLNTVAGPCVPVVTNRGTSGCVPRYWTAGFQAAYADLVQHLGVRYDGDPRVLSISNGACGVLFSEPFIKGGPEVGAALAKAGDDDAGEHYCLRTSAASQAAALPSTHQDYGDNLGWGIPRPGGLKRSWPEERDMMNELIADYGPLFLPDYHGMGTQSSSYTGPASTAPDLFGWMKAIAGRPSNAQRGCSRKGPCTDAGAIQAAIDLGVCRVEMVTNGSDLTDAQVADFSAELAANCGHVTATGLLLPLSIVSASAAPATRISRVQYDSPGSDSGSNRSLNAEWVKITNHGSRAKRLTGWTLRDLQHHVYRFPQFKLRPGESLRVHTGKGANGAHNLYWRQSYYVWNNTGDKVILKTRSGHVVDTCKWGDGSGVINC